MLVGSSGVHTWFARDITGFVALYLSSHAGAVPSVAHFFVLMSHQIGSPA
jgi:hypothetical protein